MNNANNYTASDLIYLFLDGKADSIQKKMLFGSLAGDQALQAEFQDALDIKGALLSDKEGVKPSSALTAAVFAGAGFSSPFAGTHSEPAPSQAAPASTPKPFFTGLSRFLPGSFMSAAIGSLATAAAFIFLLNPYLFNNSKYVNNIENKGTHASAANGLKSSIPLVSSTEVQNDQPSVAAKDTVIKYIVITREPSLANNMDENSQIDKGDAARNVSFINNNLTPGQPVVMLSSLDNIGGSKYGVVNSGVYRPTDLNDYRESRGIIELKALSSFAHYPNRPIDAQQENPFNNINVSLLLKASSKLDLGFELGRESFQMYSVTQTITSVEKWFERSGKMVKVMVPDTTYNFEKMQSLYWLGAKGRYTFDYIKPLDNLRLFTSLSAGWAPKMGMIGKLGLGFTYDPENTFYFSLGVEGTGLVYMAKDGKSSQLKIHAPATKLGVFYNMGYHF